MTEEYKTPTIDEAIEMAKALKEGYNHKDIVGNVDLYELLCEKWILTKELKE